MENLFSDNLTAENISSTIDEIYNQQLKKSATEVERLILERKNKGYKSVIIEPEVVVNRNIQKAIMEELQSERRKFRVHLVAPDDAEIGDMWNIEIKW